MKRVIIFIVVLISLHSYGQRTTPFGTTKDTVEVMNFLIVDSSFRVKHILPGIGKKALRYDPSTGKITYADTTTGSAGGADTLHFINVGNVAALNSVYTNGADSAFAKKLLANNGLTGTTDTDSTNHIKLGGDLTGTTNITGATTTYALNLGTSGNKLLQLAVAATNMFVNARFQFASSVATDANYTVANSATYVILPAITANRTVTLSTVGSGDYMIILNENTSGNTWSFAGTTVKDAAGNTITNLLNGTSYQLIYDGTNYIVIAKN